MFRLLITIAIVGALAFCGATVPLGKKTFFGHVKSIWSSDEMSELKDGVKDSAGPASERAKDFVKGGVEAVKKKETERAIDHAADKAKDKVLGPEPKAK